MELKREVIRLHQPDETGDIFSKGLPVGKKVPLTRNFDSDKIIGEAEVISETETICRFNASEVLYMSEEPAIGFRLMDYDCMDDGTRVIKDFELIEVSLTANKVKHA